MGESNVLTHISANFRTQYLEETDGYSLHDSFSSTNKYSDKDANYITFVTALC
jgi:hypothetical protein